jgi:hypothetical protein
MVPTKVKGIERTVGTAGQLFWKILGEDCIAENGGRLKRTRFKAVQDTISTIDASNRPTKHHKLHWLKELRYNGDRRPDHQSRPSHAESGVA